MTRIRVVVESLVVHGVQPGAVDGEALGRRVEEALRKGLPEGLPPAGAPRQPAGIRLVHAEGAGAPEHGLAERLAHAMLTALGEVG
jgi:hypothetical protein